MIKSFQDLIKEYSLDKVQETTTEKIKQHYDDIREATKLIKSGKLVELTK